MNEIVLFDGDIENCWRAEKAPRCLSYFIAQKKLKVTKAYLDYMLPDRFRGRPHQLNLDATGEGYEIHLGEMGSNSDIHGCQRFRR